MVEHLGESKTNLTHTNDLPMDDMLDGSDIHQQPEKFDQVLSYIHSSLYEDYLSHDREAIHPRRNGLTTPQVPLDAALTKDTSRI